MKDKKIIIFGCLIAAAGGPLTSLLGFIGWLVGFIGLIIAVYGLTQLKKL